MALVTGDVSSYRVGFVAILNVVKAAEEAFDKKMYELCALLTYLARCWFEGGNKEIQLKVDDILLYIAGMDIAQLKPINDKAI